MLLLTLTNILGGGRGILSHARLGAASTLSVCGAGESLYYKGEVEGELSCSMGEAGGAFTEGEDGYGAPPILLPDPNANRPPSHRLTTPPCPSRTPARFPVVCLPASLNYRLSFLNWSVFQSPSLRVVCETITTSTLDLLVPLP